MLNINPLVMLSSNSTDACTPHFSKSPKIMLFDYFNFIVIGHCSMVNDKLAAGKQKM